MRRENQSPSSKQLLCLHWEVKTDTTHERMYFVDDGYSGTSFSRPDWQRLTALIDEDRIGIIIVKDMSRLGRDYLQVGMYTEMVFPAHDIRFIAINNGVDSENQVDNDMTPFINIFNEFYAKDTSKKVKAVFRAKGNAGKPLLYAEK